MVQEVHSCVEPSDFAVDREGVVLPELLQTRIPAEDKFRVQRLESKEINLRFLGNHFDQFDPNLFDTACVPTVGIGYHNLSNRLANEPQAIRGMRVGGEFRKDLSRVHSIEESVDFSIHNNADNLAASRMDLLQIFSLVDMISEDYIL